MVGLEVGLLVGSPGAGVGINRVGLADGRKEGAAVGSWEGSDSKCISKRLEEAVYKFTTENRECKCKTAQVSSIESLQSRRSESRA